MRLSQRIDLLYCKLRTHGQHRWREVTPEQSHCEFCGSTLISPR